MNYQTIYADIINNAKTSGRVKGVGSYYENHHIIPKSLGGDNSKDNLVLLTPKEHFICHLLLVKIYADDNDAKIKMARAFLMLSRKNSLQQRYINSRLYENIKSGLFGDGGKLSGRNASFYGKSHSIETRKTLSESKVGDLNPMFGKLPWNFGKTAETDIRIRQSANKQKQSTYNTDRSPISSDTKELLSIAAKANRLGKHKTNDHKNSIRETMANLYDTETGKARLLEMNLKSIEKTKGVPKETVSCPHCKKSGGKPSMMRFHFDNCKDKI